MSHNPYDYENRQDIQLIGWNNFHALCKALALAVDAYAPELILAVGRGGYYPGTLLAHMRQVEVYPIRLSRRVRDVVTHATPQWLVGPPSLVQGQRVLIVDEISSTGETLMLAKQKVETLGASAVRSAVLYAHSWSAHIPDYIGLISDALLLNPWDREIVQAGQFHFHPEYVEALAQQGIAADASLLIPAAAVQVAKG
jgi:hypoxanthine phosphoribosyltransferase